MKMFRISKYDLKILLFKYLNKTYKSYLQIKKSPIKQHTRSIHSTHTHSRSKFAPTEACRNVLPNPESDTY